MTTDRETKRVVRSWLQEGVTQLPDRVLDAVLDQLPATHQRRAGWLGRWLTILNSNALRLGVAAVVIIAAAFLGLTDLPGGGGVGGPTGPTATPAPTPTPTPTPVGLLPQGSHRLWDAGVVSITVTIPAPGWHGEPGGGILEKNDFSDVPDGAGMIVFGGLGDIYVYGDPCRWLTTRPDTPATTVDELVVALGAQVSRDASAPVDITLDGYAGRSITLHVPDDAVHAAGRFSECDRGEFRTLVEGPDGARYHQGPGQIDRLWIVDVNGELVVIDIGYYEGTPQAVVDELEAIVESITFE
jgi:hypothetical protein